MPKLPTTAFVKTRLNVYVRSLSMLKNITGRSVQEDNHFKVYAPTHALACLASYILAKAKPTHRVSMGGIVQTLEDSLHDSPLTNVHQLHLYTTYNCQHL